MARREEVEVVRSANTVILPCTCRHVAQDKAHGVGRRVHNRTKQNKPVSEQRWRCTVCKAEKPL